MASGDERQSVASSNFTRWWMALSSLILMALCAGCGPPQVSYENLELTSSLRTALSARNSEWLDENVRSIEERRAAGKMGDAEHEAFQSIVSQAKAGDWEAAEREVVELQKAQRPTREMIERVHRGDGDS